MVVVTGLRESVSFSSDDGSSSWPNRKDDWVGEDGGKMPSCLHVLGGSSL